MMTHRLTGSKFVAHALLTLVFLLVSVSAQARQDQGARPSPQAAASAPSTAAGGFHDEVVYETVYDLETIQVPVTTNETRYRTEYRTQTVPLTRTVTEQIP